MQTAVIILFRIMKRKKNFFLQNNDTKFKTRGKRFAPDNPYNLY